MRVLLSGYYGFGNLGDEALLEVVVARMRARFPRLDLEVLSFTPEATARAYGVEAAQRWEMRSVRAAIRRADVVLSGGGGLLQSATSLRSLLYYAGILREASRLMRTTMVFAQSIGPLDPVGRMVVRRLCRGVDAATVRDERSRALLASLLPKTPVERTADPVFLYEPPLSNDLARDGLAGDGRPYAVVSVRNAPGFSSNVVALARAIDRLSTQHGVRVAFLPLGGTADAAASTDVIRACKSAPVLLPHPTLAHAAHVLGSATFVIGMRLHALILAARAHVPFFAISYDPKVDALLEDLAYPVEPLHLARRVPETEASALLEGAFARRETLRAHLAASVQPMKRRAERNFDVLASLLESA